MTVAKTQCHFLIVRRRLLRLLPYMDRRGTWSSGSVASSAVRCRCAQLSTWPSECVAASPAGLLSWPRVLCEGLRIGFGVSEFFHRVVSGMSRRITTVVGCQTTLSRSDCWLAFISVCGAGCSDVTMVTDFVWSHSMAGSAGESFSSGVFFGGSVSWLLGYYDGFL